MKVTVITGASSGMGQEFAKRIAAQGKSEEIWLIARRADRLQALGETLPCAVRVIAQDLTAPDMTEHFSALLVEAQPEIVCLVNAGGYAKFGSTDEIPLADSLGMIDLNCRALTAITTLCQPYLAAGAEVYQFASLAAFQPLPYLSVYAATKAYVLSYTRALGAELRQRGIRVMAICPGWVQTEFFDRAKTVNADVVTHFYHIYRAEDVVRRALKDMKRGRSVSVHGTRTRALIRLGRLVPTRFVMGIWMCQQKLPRGRRKVKE